MDFSTVIDNSKLAFIKLTSSLSELTVESDLKFRKPREINQHARRMEIVSFQWIFSALDEREFNFSRPKWNETRRDIKGPNRDRENSMRGSESRMESSETMTVCERDLTKRDRTGKFNLERCKSKNAQSPFSNSVANTQNDTRRIYLPFAMAFQCWHWHSRSIFLFCRSSIFTLLTQTEKLP